MIEKNRKRAEVPTSWARTRWGRRGTWGAECSSFTQNSADAPRARPPRAAFLPQAWVLAVVRGVS